MRTVRSGSGDDYYIILDSDMICIIASRHDVKIKTDMFMMDTEAMKQKFTRRYTLEGDASLSIGYAILGDRFGQRK